jgi:hypothetical protein
MRSRVGFRAIARWQRASPYRKVAKTRGAFAAGDLVSGFAAESEADPFPFAIPGIVRDAVV